jgi:hypothetical protein
MQAFLIDPSKQAITPIELTQAESEIAALIGQKSIGFDEIDDNGDRLYFDEACFINEKPGGGRFKLDSLPPVAGRGVVVGADKAGQAQSACVSAQALAARVKFL